MTNQPTLLDAIIEGYRAGGFANGGSKSIYNLPEMPGYLFSIQNSSYNLPAKLNSTTCLTPAEAFKGSPLHMFGQAVVAYNGDDFRLAIHPKIEGVTLEEFYGTNGWNTDEWPQPIFDDFMKQVQTCLKYGHEPDWNQRNVIVTPGEGKNIPTKLTLIDPHFYSQQQEDVRACYRLLNLITGVFDPDRCNAVYHKVLEGAEKAGLKLQPFVIHGKDGSPQITERLQNLVAPDPIPSISLALPKEITAMGGLSLGATREVAIEYLDRLMHISRGDQA